MTVELKLDINKKLLISGVIAIVILAFIFWGNFSGPEASVFGGDVIKVEGNNVSLEGFYMTSDGAEYAILKAESNAEKRTVTAEITPQTQFAKTVFAIPDLESGQIFRPSDLNRETMPGSLEELERERPGVFVIASKNIFGKSKFEIIKVEYVIPIFPE